VAGERRETNLVHPDAAAVGLKDLLLPEIADLYALNIGHRYCRRQSRDLAFEVQMQGRTPRLVLVSVSKLEVRVESNYKSGFPSSLDSIESYEEWFI
jgi:hypothetical protein